MEVALYVRVSTTRQQQTQTIEQQLARLREYVVTQPEWHLAEEHIYRDDGYSGAKLNRPGLDRLRDRAALAVFERVLMTAPDRLARNYVHQVLLIEELAQRGCQVEFLERPMSQDPHDQLLLQIRGAVAEYERTLIADRMRRGRQAKLRSGQLLPWSVPPYGYVMDPERPRDPQRLRLDPVKAAVITQIFAWYTDPQTPATLYSVAKRLTDDHIPTPRGGPRWNVASVRGILRSPVYTGTAYSERTRPVPARIRQSALRPVGPGHSHRPAPPEEWIAIPVPAIINQETFAAAQARLARNTQMARRHNITHDYLLRGLVSCGQCQLACTGRTLPPGYHYYLCRGRTDALRAARGERCTARFAPARALDELVWQDLGRILREPALITHALARAHGGEWLPQALQARRKTLREALTQLERQQARLLEVYLAEIIGRDEFERKRQEVTHTQHGLTQQLRQLEAQAQQQVDTAALAQGLEAFCRRLQPTLDQLTFAQRRQLVELLIDHVIVTHDQVEIRYVVPTGPKGETTPFCHLRLDYLRRPPLFVNRCNRGGAHMEGIGPEHVMLAGFWVPVPHPPQHRGGGIGLLPQQDPVVVRGQSAVPVHLKALCHLEPHVDLLAGDEVHPVLRQTEQKTVVDVAPVHRDDAALGKFQATGNGNIAPLTLGEDHKGWQVARMVEEGMPLDGAFSLAEAGPGEEAQAEGDGGAVQGIEGAFEAETVPWRHRPATLIQGGKDGLVQCGRPPLVGLGHSGALRRGQTEGSQRLGLGGQGAHHIPQAVASCQLGED